MAQRSVGDSISRVLVMYGVIGFALAALGVSLVANGSALQGAITGGFGGFLLWSVFASRNNSATPVIERSAIRRVEARPPRPPLARGYFVVTFEEGGKERRRLILLPGSMSGGRAEYDKARDVLTAAGLLTAT